MTYSIWRNQNPKIAVIISTYNDEKYLQKCLDSLETCLKNKDWALFVGIDGSTDNSLEILQKHQTSAKIYIVDKFEKAKTVGEAKNRAIKLAVPYLYEYECIMFHDADDEMLPGRVDFLLPLTVKNNNIASVGDYYVESEDFPEYHKKQFFARKIEHILGYFGPQKTIIHSSLIPSDGKLWNEELKSQTDVELWARWLINGINITAYSGEFVCIYNKRKNSVLNPSTEEEKQERKAQWKKIEKQLFKNKKIDISYFCKEKFVFFIEFNNLTHVNDLGILFKNLIYFHGYPDIRFIILDKTGVWGAILNDSFYKEIACGILKYINIKEYNKKQYAELKENLSYGKDFYDLSFNEELNQEKINNLLIKKWAVGIITAPRQNATLNNTLNQLINEGFEPVIFSEPNTFIDDKFNHLQRITNYTNFGILKNTFNCLTSLIGLFPNAEYFAFFEDDIEITKGIKNYLEKTLFYENCPVASLFTTKNYLEEKPGWNIKILGKYRTFGALGFVFKKDALLDFLKFFEQRLHLRFGADSCIGEWAQLRGHGITYHSPSLITHISNNSASKDYELGPITRPEIYKEIKDIPNYIKKIGDKKIGLIGWNTAQGLGYANRDIVKYLNIDTWIIPKHPKFSNLSNVSKVKTNHINVKLDETKENLYKHIKNLDLMIFVELPYIQNFAGITREYGIPNLCIPMWEWLTEDLEWLNYVDYFICPTKKTYDLLLLWKRKYGYSWELDYIPWLIDLDRFKFQKRKTFKNLLFNNGNGGMSDIYLRDGEKAKWGRKGWDIIDSIALNIKNIEINVSSQFPININSSNIRLLPQEKYNENLYLLGDIAIQPSRWEGIGLNILESMACGLPVILPDAAPMNEYGDGNFYLPCDEFDVRIFGERWIKAVEIDQKKTVDFIKQIHNTNISSNSKKVRQFIENNHNWQKNKELFKKYVE